MSQQSPSLFTQVDITAGAHIPRQTSGQFAQEEMLSLLRSMLAGQDRTNELLEEVVANMAAAQRHRNQELADWKHAHPSLAESCKYASQALTRVQAAYLDTITREINDCEDTMEDGEYAVNEFVDRFGARLAQLNGIVQVLATLGSAPSSAADERT